MLAFSAFGITTSPPEREALVVFFVFLEAAIANFFCLEARRDLQQFRV